LTVINEFGCENQTVRWIKVSPDFSVYIPSAFSPNADGTNDVFLAQGIGFTSEGFHLEIYNRWGAMVFKSDDRMVGWNGGLQNSHPEHAKSDVYVYTIILTDFSGLVHEYQGQVTLLK
jgi:gliding motility-associated-like protein